MSTTTTLAVLLMLVPGGVFTGIAVCVAVERITLWDRMSVEQYAIDYRRSIHRLDPLQPILATLAIIGAGILGADHAGAAREFALTGVGLGLVIIGGSVVVAEPMSSQFRRRSEGDAPPDVEGIRRRWKRFHYARTVSALAMLVVFVLAACSL